MVRGIEKYRESFEEFNNNYVIIGGSACSIIMEDVDVAFRATKDFDVVLIAEMASDEFYQKLWEFIELGGYKNKEKGNGKAQFYRFTNPDDLSYPIMIELFSIVPNDIKIAENTELTPIPTNEEMESLSAILLDANYYELVKVGKREVNGLSVLREEYLILMKIKAWLDLSARKAGGEAIDRRTIIKHKNDVFRLLTIVSLDNSIKVNRAVKADVERFLDLIVDDPVNLKDLRITAINFNQAVDMIRHLFNVV